MVKITKSIYMMLHKTVNVLIKTFKFDCGAKI